MISISCDKCQCTIQSVYSDKVEIGTGDDWGWKFVFEIKNDYFHEVNIPTRGKRHFCTTCYNAYKKAMEAF